MSGENTSPRAPLFDSHCHLFYDYSPKTSEQILQEAREAGVLGFMNVSTDLESLSKVEAFSGQHEDVFHTIGIHPHDAHSLDEAALQRLKTAARHPKCKAIGEIGLDYHYDHSSPQAQLAGLAAQLELALELNLPVVIHSREAEEPLLEALSAYAKKSARPSGVGVIHCFTGTLEFGKKCLDLGFFISFSGILTFKNANEVRAAAQAFPLERILIETDAPYLAPIPFRGKKAEPGMVRWTAEKLAEIKGRSFEEVARQTTRNSTGFFSLSL